jgi:hypothetical protein
MVARCCATCHIPTTTHNVAITLPQHSVHKLAWLLVLPLHFFWNGECMQVPSGSLSPYGGELHALLRYMSQPSQQPLISSKAPLDGPSWASALAGYFTDVYAGYKNKSVKSLIANIEAGKAYPATGDAKDTQANSLCKVGQICYVAALS